MSKVKKLVFAGLLIAIGVALPFVFHTIPNAGGIFLPMHIPVLLSGFICGPLYGLGVGVLTPLISSMLTGMPPVAILPGMACELAVYGLITGLLYKKNIIKNDYGNVYVSLLVAMFAGRLTYGILNSLIFRAGAYSLKVWISTAFVVSIPGIIAQLVIIPILVSAMKKTRLIQTN